MHVLYGGPDGLANAQVVFRQGAGGGFGAREEGDHFRSAPATGDFDTDGFGDLAVGSPARTSPSRGSRGVHVLNGDPTGPTGTGGGLFRQAYGDVDGTPEESERFGYRLAAGDFDGDGTGGPS